MVILDRQAQQYYVETFPRRRLPNNKKIQRIHKCLQDTDSVKQKSEGQR